MAHTHKHMTDGLTKTNRSRGSAYEPSIEKRFGAQTNLLAQNIALNTDVAQNYKYVYGPHRRP